MLYTEDMVRQNLRNRNGKRVFYLAKGDTLTPVPGTGCDSSVWKF